MFDVFVSGSALVVAAGLFVWAYLAAGKPDSVEARADLDALGLEALGRAVARARELGNG
jgi:hypothetical protein